MAIDILQSKAKTVSLYAPGTWTGITAKVLNANGTSVATPTPTHLSATVDTTVASNASTNYELVVDSATGMSVGKYLQFNYLGAFSYARIATISGSTISVWPPLPNAPYAGQTVKGAEVSATIPSGSTGTLGLNHQLVITSLEGEETREVFHVVRRLMVDSFTEADLRSYVFARWPSNTLAGFQFSELANNVRAELRSELLATGNYGHTFLDPTATKQAGLAIASRLLVSQYGLMPPGNTDMGEFMENVREDEMRYVGRMISSMEAADKDDDGVPDENSPKIFSIRLVR